LANVVNNIKSGPMNIKGNVRAYTELHREAQSDTEGFSVDLCEPLCLSV